MRRADRLFEIIEILRRTDGTATADQIAEQTEVSVRTIYRDIASLQAGRVPIDGEAGVGYTLRPSYDLPPLMFNDEEAEAIALGARIVAAWGDKELAARAQSALGKVRAVLTGPLKEQIDAHGLIAPPYHHQVPIEIDLAEIRRAIRHRIKIRFLYTPERGRKRWRTAWPLSLAFFGPVWTVPCWCEMREDFRSFRPDRMEKLELLDETYPRDPKRNLRAFTRKLEDEYGKGDRAY